MAEKPFDARELVEALSGDAAGENATSPSSTSTPPPPPKPLTIEDLPKEILVSILMASEDPFWVRHTFPLVCKAWNELYLSKDASPLHEALEVDFRKEILWAAGEREAEEEESDDRWEPGPDDPVVHASRVISWAQKRASSVQKLLLKGEFSLDLEDFGADDLGALVGVVGSSSTEILVDFDSCDLYEEPFWKALRDSVVPAGRLRSFVIRGIEHIESDIFESYVEPLVQLAGSLEELELGTAFPHDPENFDGEEVWLPRFPESFFGLKKLRRLALVGHPLITAIPAEISSLKKLEDLRLSFCDLSSLPKELGKLSGLTLLDLSWNAELGRALPAHETFPAELGNLKSLRVLDLSGCELRTVPAFVGELESLESLNLSFDGINTQIDAQLDFLARGCPRLREMKLDGGLPRFPGSLCALTELRRLKLRGRQIETIPAEISSLKKLEDLDLSRCSLSSLPKELGELPGLTRIDLSRNEELELTPEREAFPAELGRLKSLRVLSLSFCGLGAVPAFVGELESLESLNLSRCSLSSLPKELGELSGLTKLDLSYNGSLGNEVFPEELGKMKSLRKLYLRRCGLGTVPAFVGKLESLEVLDLGSNDNLQIDVPLDFLIKGCSHLRAVDLEKRPDGRPWTPQSLARLEAFKARLLAQNPVAKVEYKF